MAENILIRVFDPKLNFLGEISDYDSLIYTRKWFTYSDFQLTLSYIHPRLIQNNIIMLDSDPYCNGIIKYVQYDEDKKTVTVKGYSLLWLLSQRITKPPAGQAAHIITGTEEEIMRALVESNAVNSPDAQRRIPLLVLGDLHGYGSKTTYQSRYQVLSEEVKALAQASLLGPGIRLELETGHLIFDVRQGVDRTVQQSRNPVMVFRPDHGNIDSRVYTLDDSGTKNCAYTAGQGDGADRIVVVVGDELSGTDRREVFVDARDIEDNTLLPERGRTKLAAMQRAESYESSVDTSGYRGKWDLGDIVTVLDPDMGLTINKQVVEIEVVEDNKRGREIVPTFGIPQKSLVEAVSNFSSSGSSGGGGNRGTYIYTQTTPISTWTITHNLGQLPSVTVVDSSGSVVIGDTAYIDRNTIQISFSAAFAGMAYLN